ncbi:MAG: hypothetical protein OXH56_08445 [Gemmatimonadetes bacterium]|nr:hypothetical protein [Gemmatimonadota bacterium]
MNLLPSGHHFPRWIWAVYAALFALSIPWYLPEIEPVPVWLGVPYWVVICLAACLAIACFTAFVIHRYWQEEG